MVYSFFFKWVKIDSELLCFYKQKPIDVSYRIYYDIFDEHMWLNVM